MKILVNGYKLVIMTFGKLRVTFELLNFPNFTYVTQ